MKEDSVASASSRPATGWSHPSEPDYGNWDALRAWARDKANPSDMTPFYRDDRRLAQVVLTLMERIEKLEAERGQG